MRWQARTLLLMIVSAIRADQEPFMHSKAFDQGKYGIFVSERYKSSSLEPPRPNLFERHGICDNDELLIMLTPRGWAVPHPGPTILDGSGRLIWTDPSYIQPYNLQVQSYRGEKFLTFWAGDDGVKGHGAGFYYMVKFALCFSFYLADDANS